VEIIAVLVEKNSIIRYYNHQSLLLYIDKKLIFLLVKNMKDREILSKVALTETLPDTIINNGILFNSFTREFIRGQSIWIKNGMIAYVGPDHDLPKKTQTFIIDAEGQVMLPGLIDGHTHILKRTGVEEFTKYVIPTGVTTVVTESLEIGTIAGIEGIKYFASGLACQPIRFYYTIAPLCRLTLSSEKNIPTNKQFTKMLKDPRCLGIGEVYWGNIFLEGQQGQRVRELVSIALDHGKRIEGHTAGATGRKLQAFTCFGISSCHEPVNEDEVIERLRLGYWVMIREGAVRKELNGVKGIFNKKIDFRRLILSTDSMDPEGFIEEGYLDASLKKALSLGVPPDLAYQMVTINAAEHFRLDHLIGSLSPGKMADLLMIPSPGEFSPTLVMCDGKIIFKDNKTIVQPRKVFFPDEMFNTVKVQGFTFPPIPNKGMVRVIELVTRLVTKEKIINLDNLVESQDVIMILAIDRLKKKNAFMGFLKGFGLQKGACGSTMCWDTTDMIVVGCDLKSMKTVVERLKEINGGAVFAIGNEVIAEFAAPLCGIISLEPMEILRDKMKRLESSLRGNGVRWEKPILTIDTLGTAAIPHVRVTHHGYVRLKDREILSAEI